MSIYLITLSSVIQYRVHALHALPPIKPVVGGIHPPLQLALATAAHGSEEHELPPHIA